MANPLVSRSKFVVSGKPLTVDGVIKKSAFMLALSAAVGVGFFFFAALNGLSAGFIQAATLISVFGGIGLMMFMASKPQYARKLAVPFACLEGFIIGSASLMAYSISPSLPFTAMAATFITAAVMLGLYSAGVVKVTQKFRSIIISAGMAIFFLYLIQIAMSFIFSSSLPYLFDGGIVAIGFSVFTTTIASFFLLLDFDNVERLRDAGVSDEFEWLLSASILATLVWMYVEFVRLLGYLQD